MQLQILSKLYKGKDRIELTEAELLPKHKKHDNLLTPISSYFNQNCIIGIFLPPFMIQILVYEKNLNTVHVKRSQSRNKQGRGQSLLIGSFFEMLSNMTFPPMFQQRSLLFQSNTSWHVIPHLFPQSRLSPGGLCPCGHLCKKSWGRTKQTLQVWFLCFPPFDTAALGTLLNRYLALLNSLF